MYELRKKDELVLLAYLAFDNPPQQVFYKLDMTEGIKSLIEIGIKVQGSLVEEAQLLEYTLDQAFSKVPDSLKRQL